MQWPTLAEPYQTALQEAVTAILNRFDTVVGIIASGTIIRGNPHPSSDLDIYVVHTTPMRQRIQQVFNGVPAEIFVNPVSAIEHYFSEECASGRPLTAHMLATGFVMLNRQPELIATLREKALAILESQPNPSSFRLQMARYGAATLMEDAVDIADRDPNTATLIMGRAVYDMLHYAFWTENKWLPRDKDLLNATTKLNEALGMWTRRYYAASTWDERLEAATQIADRTIKATGFFEWETEPQPFD